MASKVDDKIEPEEAMREIDKKESTDTNDGEMTVKPAVGMEALRKPAAKRLKLHEAATTRFRYKIPPDVSEAINKDILLMAQGREPEMKASVDINLYKIPPEVEEATTQVEEATPRYKIPPDVLEAINRDILLMAQGREPEMKASVDINLYKTSAKMLDDGLET